MKIADTFSLEGEFWGLCAVDGSFKLKYLMLKTPSSGQYVIKVPKEYRGELAWKYTIGDRIRVRGIQTEPLKAYSIEKISGEPAHTCLPNHKTKYKILVCQKSDCCNQGAREIYANLQQELTRRGLEDQIDIKATGCLKQCKQAPNLVVLPQNLKLGRVKSSQIRQIIDQAIL